jgi:hypothetical protein
LSSIFGHTDAVSAQDDGQMNSGARLSVTDQRRSARHPVDCPLIATHRERGDMAIHIANLSQHGFMIDDAGDLARGDRLLIRLPLVGQIEALCMWLKDERAGFQFERIIREDHYEELIRQLQPNPALRRRR